MGNSWDRYPPERANFYYADPHSNQATRVDRSELNFERLASDIEIQCEKWKNIIKNIRREQMSGTEKRNYIESEFKETMDKINSYFPTSVQREKVGPGNVKGAPRPTPKVHGHGQQGEVGDMKQLIHEKIELQKHLAQFKQENEKLQEVQAELTKANDDLKKALSQVRDEKTSMEKKAKEEMKKTEEELDDLKTRLSKLIGDRLRDNNPNIADLSDPNRPTKLGEVYSELYDNEYTDAFDALTKSGYTDEYAIETLRLTLMNCWKFSKEMSDQMVKQLEETLKKLFGTLEESHVQQTRGSLTLKPKAKVPDQSIHLKSLHERLKLQKRWAPKETTSEPPPSDLQQTMIRPLDLEKKLQKERKDAAASFVPLVQKAYMKTLFYPNELLPEMKPFIKKCLFVTWMMAVQTPPMCFDGDVHAGKPFDVKCYKEFMKRGPKVAFVVWPAVRLHENGPLIGKGVAQGMDV